MAHGPQGRVEKMWTSQVALPLCSSLTCVGEEGACPWDEQMAGAPGKLMLSVYSPDSDENSEEGSVKG